MHPVRELQGDEENEKNERHRQGYLHATEQHGCAVDGDERGDDGGREEADAGNAEDATAQIVDRQAAEQSDGLQEQEEPLWVGGEKAETGEDEKPERVVAIGRSDSVECRTEAVGEVLRDFKVVEKVIFEKDHPRFGKKRRTQAGEDQR